MEQSSLPLLPANVGATSSMRSLKTEFIRLGVLRSQSGRLKDSHFQDHVLPITLKTVSDVKAHLRSLDTQAKVKHGGICEKAAAARRYIGLAHNPDIPLLRWTHRALADARHTECNCHESDTYHPKP